MNRLGMLGAIAMLGLGLGGDGRSSYRRREWTLDEEEAQSAHRMLRRAQQRRRMAERAILRETAAHAARIAAEIEAARPKSRQELRAAARKKTKRLRQDRCFQKGERRP